jgi:hypothetical protein
MPIPFAGAEQRDEWIRTHREGTGHTVTAGGELTATERIAVAFCRGQGLPGDRGLSDRQVLDSYDIMPLAEAVMSAIREAVRDEMREDR